VRELIAGGRAVWCPAIQLELWRGCNSKTDRDDLRQLQEEIHSLEMSAEVWEYGFEIAAKCRPRGLVVPSSDLMIFACAQVHRVELFACDKHFDMLAKIATG
jgi:predicted nucleic acid-binding protein